MMTETNENMIHVLTFNGAVDELYTFFYPYINECIHETHVCKTISTEDKIKLIIENIIIENMDNIHFLLPWEFLPTDKRLEDIYSYGDYNDFITWRNNVFADLFLSKLKIEEKHIQKIKSML